MSGQETRTENRMRAGMPLPERQQLRADLLEQLLTMARDRAAEMYVSARCMGHLAHRSGAMSEDQRRAEHVKCQAESAGNGCLCEWHDAEIKPAPDAPAQS